MKTAKVFRFIILIIILVFIAFLLTGCIISFPSLDMHTKPEMPSTNQEQYKDLLLVEEVCPGYLRGTINKTNTKMHAPNWFENDVDVQIGTFVTIYHNGIILESYPGQYGCIYSMEYLGPDGELIIKYPSGTLPTTPDESVSKPHTVYIETYQDEVLVQKYLAPDDADLLFNAVQNMQDGSEYVCNCIPKYMFVIDGNEYYYHDHSGLIIDNQTKQYFLINNKDNVQKIIEYYFDNNRGEV